MQRERKKNVTRKRRLVRGPCANTFKPGVTSSSWSWPFVGPGGTTRETIRWLSFLSTLSWNDEDDNDNDNETNPRQKRHSRLDDTGLRVLLIQGTRVCVSASAAAVLLLSYCSLSFCLRPRSCLLDAFHRRSSSNELVFSVFLNTGKSEIYWAGRSYDFTFICFYFLSCNTLYPKAT